MTLHQLKPREIFPEHSPEDLQKLFELDVRVAESTPVIYSIESLEKFIQFLTEHGKTQTYVLGNGGHFIGYVSLIIDRPKSVEILSLAIDPERKRQGYGRQLMNFTEVLARQNHKIKLCLLTNPANKPAISLYKSLGFKIIGEKKSYYGNGVSLVFEKDLLT